MSLPVLPPRITRLHNPVTPPGQTWTPGQIDTTAPWLSDAEKQALGEWFENLLNAEENPSPQQTAPTASSPSANPTPYADPNWARAYFTPTEQTQRSIEHDAWQRYEEAPTSAARQAAFRDYMRLTQHGLGIIRTETPNPGVQPAENTYTPAEPEGADTAHETFPAGSIDKDTLIYSGTPVTAHALWRTERPLEAALPTVMMNQTTRTVTTQFEKKIESQMSKRGWDKESIKSTIENPLRTVQTRDTRWKPDGTRKDDPATAYLREDGHYVVRNDIDCTIVQISNRNKIDWKSPFE